MTAAAEGRPFDAQPFGLATSAGLAALGKALGAMAPKLDRKTRIKLGRGDSPRSGQPVWRNSYYVGQVESKVWRPINGGSKRGGRRWTRALLKAAKAFELRTLYERRETTPRARMGALGQVAIDVLEYLYEVVNYATGRLEPAIRTIAAATGHAYSAVHAAKQRLYEHGFLAWMRRSEPIDDPVPGGPLVKQASNAYGLLVPEGMRAWLGRLIGPPPMPACEEDRRRRQKAEFDAMIAGLTPSEYVNDFVRDTLLGPTLRSLAAAVERRESQDRESSMSDETGRADSS